MLSLIQISESPQECEIMENSLWESLFTWEKCIIIGGSMTQKCGESWIPPHCDCAAEESGKNKWSHFLKDTHMIEL